MANGTVFNALASALGTAVQKIAGEKVVEKYSGRIPDDHVLNTGPGDGWVLVPIKQELGPDSSYFQVLVNHMYIGQARKLWVTFEHLGVAWMRFRYNGDWQTVPFIVDRNLFSQGVKNLPTGARIEFDNVRVGNTYPYAGDSLALYLGLWRAPMEDWATTIFGAIDTLAGKVKVAASLSQVVEMLDGINQAVSQILGLNKITALLNLYQEFQDPTFADVGVLRPGYYVMVNAPATTFDPTKLWVLNGKLHSWNGQQQTAATPYYEHDYLLYSINSLQQFPGAVDTFNKQYKKVLAVLIGSKEDAKKLAQAAQEYHTLQSQIVTSPDLTTPDRNRLIDYYQAALNADAMRFAVNLKDSSVPFAAGTEELQLPASLLANVPLPTEEGFAAHSAGLDNATLTANPTAHAGVAAAQFAATLQQVSAEPGS